MKSRIDGSFVFSIFLAAFVLICVVEARNFPPLLQVATNIAGYSTLTLIGLLLLGTFRPEILSWTETTLQDMWGGGKEGARDEGAAGEGNARWPAVLRVMGYAVGFLLLAFLFGFFVVPPVFLALFLIVEAEVRPLPAIVAAVVATALLDGGMMLVHVEVWAGIIPEVIEGYLGGAIMPPL